MKVITIPALSQQYLRAQVQPFDVNGAITDPRAASVFWAFTNGNADPQPGDWFSGDWETGTVNGSAVYYARYMIQSGRFISGSSYAIWLKISGVTEIPVFLLGTLVIV